MSRRTLATLYGAGLSPIAPGTVGSLVAVALAYLMLQLPYGWELLGIGTVVYTVLGTRSASQYMQAHGTDHDPKEIVVDELAGQWLTYVLAPVLCAWLLGKDVFDALLYPPYLYKHLLWGFVLFRLLDILKPWPIRWADRTVHGGWGVMLDDLLAGILSAFVLCYLDASLPPLVA